MDDFNLDEVDDCFADDIMSTRPSECDAAIRDFKDYVFMNYVNIDCALFPLEIWVAQIHHIYSHIHQLFEALNEVQTGTYTHMYMYIHIYIS